MENLKTFASEIGVTGLRNFSEENSDASLIVNSLTELARCSMASNFGHTNLVDKDYKMDKKIYNQLNSDTKASLLTFMAETVGTKGTIESAKDVVRLFEKTGAREVYNAIVTDTLETIILGAEPAGLMKLCNIYNVDLGDSESFEIDGKGLPIAQRNSYTSNVQFLDGNTKQTITVTPKVYSVGIQMDFIRILDNSFDFGREIAKIAMSILYAQYKLVAKILFDSNSLTGTPFYFANYNQEKFMLAVQALETINGGAPVVAYGTKPAFFAIGSLLTKNFGLASQDKMINDGYLGQALGVPNVVIDQAFDGSVPLAADMKNLLIPDNYILLICSNGDKPVKLVRENFVRSIDKDPTDGTLYRKSYKYFMSFDAAMVTQSSYGLMGTTTI